MRTISNLVIDGVTYKLPEPMQFDDRTDMISAYNRVLKELAERFLEKEELEDDI